LPPLFAVLLIAALVFGLSLLWLEARHRLRPASPLRLSSGNWSVKRKSDERLEVKGTIAISNPHARMEVFVPEIELRPTLLGRGDLQSLELSRTLTPQHPDEEARADGYWFAYIVKGHKSTQAEVRININAPAGTDLRKLVDTLWLEILWTNYGPFGRLQKRDGVLIPLRRRRQPNPTPPGGAAVIAARCCRFAPICSAPSTSLPRCCAITPEQCCNRATCSPSVRPPWR
jgi:hypothetical protein